MKFSKWINEATLKDFKLDKVDLNKEGQHQMVLLWDDGRKQVEWINPFDFNEHYVLNWDGSQIIELDRTQPSGYEEHGVEFIQGTVKDYEKTYKAIESMHKKGDFVKQTKNSNKIVQAYAKDIMYSIKNGINPRSRLEDGIADSLPDFDVTRKW